MKTFSVLFIIYFYSFQEISAQTFNSISGKIIDDVSDKNLQNVNVKIFKTAFQTQSAFDGTFQLNNFPQGEYILRIILVGYETKKIPLTVIGNNEEIDLGIIRLSEKLKEERENGFINLSEEELYEDEKGESNTISGILVSSKDVFLKTVAYEFSPTFFKPRNLGSEYSQVLLNGVKMNKLYNSRPQWSNWGGLNDVLRNQEFASNLSPSNVTFSGIAGSTNINTRSSTYRKGVKISYASSNRSYKRRIMGSYSSGLLQNGWAYTISASRRFANEGFREGTLYSANSFFVSVEKKMNDKHSFNFTTIYASNIRGKSSPITQEIYNLKGIKYNSYWGNQEGEMRNSRIRKIEEPIFQLNHFWNINKKISLQTNATYQFGKFGNSRLDYGGTRIIIGNGNQNIIGGGANPDPMYYQKLPSYFLRNNDNLDYSNAYLAEQEFLNNGQVNWTDLFTKNQNTVANGGNTIYALYEDRNDDKQLSINSILYAKIDEKFTLNGAIGYKKLKSENFANMLDLLGGNKFLDVDVYSNNLKEAQSDLQHPNRTIAENERYKYNFILNASVLESFIQTQYNSKKTDTYIALNYSNTNYQRIGLYENGSFPENQSLGESAALNFSNFGVKSGFTYKLSGRHLFSISAAYLTKAPTLQNSFSNMRENNDIVIGLTDEKNALFDISYYLRHPKINLKLTGYFTKQEDQTQISFYFADGLSGLDSAENTAFVQEVLTGIDKQNIGIEMGIEIPIISGLKLKGVVAIGKSVYTNNPNLYLTSDSFTKSLKYGKSYLKNYAVSGGPQQAYSFGFEYSSPKYWWFGATGNHFSNAYINVSPIIRTKNFYTDIDGLPFNDYDENIAKELLQQEKFDSYFLINIVGGKSWKIDKYYIGFFANVSNILNTEYKTGGFEQSRNVNYKTLKKDKSRNLPLFGPKYWFGYGTNYYASVYFRF
ncbi:MAG: carboxypeptidase-like regulatory domain-containing protein [Flavobacteriaceae bacterium]|nr:carboxypeptidase-like regulatory domain-containing protein [Flavobacteriaceae bacterium]